MLKTIVLLMLSTFALSTGASGCHAKQNAALPPQTPNSETTTKGLKVLAEGFHSSVTNPFIAVVRDAETYSELTRLDNNLPKLDEEFFKSNIVVAAFLGERNTGGYSVEITREANGDTRISEKAPGKGVMVPQMVTSPFKLVSVPVGGAPPVLLSLDGKWRQRMRSYRVTGGRFTMSDGIAGTAEQFGLEGEMRTIRENSLVTFIFGVLSSGPEKKRSLIDFTTGVVNPDGHLAINKMSADSLVNPPNAGLKVTGTFTGGDSKISLSLNSLPTMIADGYSGVGTIEATLINSAPKP